MLALEGGQVYGLHAQRRQLQPSQEYRVSIFCAEEPLAGSIASSPLLIGHLCSYTDDTLTVLHFRTAGARHLTTARGALYCIISTVKLIMSS
jgi:hypothetical protein